MNWLGRLWAERKQWSAAALAPFLSGDRLWIAVGAVVVLGVALILAVCWLAHRTKGEEDVEIDQKDLRIDVYRSTGPGGQSVNTTDSAVRITHISTGITAACQNERSQLQNRAVAMRILKARLAERMRREQHEKLESLRGERRGIDFGSQIRSYVLAPYRLVKDHRTNVETGDVDRVLDGDIDRLIEAELRRRAENGQAA